MRNKWRKTNEMKVKNEVEGKWLQQGRMYPLLLHRSPGITMAHKWQQRVPKACITLADPNADMEADTVHKTSWRDTLKTQTPKLTCHKDKCKHIQVHLDLKGLHGGTKQEWSWTKCKASRVKKQRHGSKSLFGPCAERFYGGWGCVLNTKNRVESRLTTRAGANDL